MKEKSKENRSVWIALAIWKATQENGKLLPPRRRLLRRDRKSKTTFHQISF